MAKKAAPAKKRASKKAPAKKKPAAKKKTAAERRREMVARAAVARTGIVGGTLSDEEKEKTVAALMSEPTLTRAAKRLGLRYGGIKKRLENADIRERYYRACKELSRMVMARAESLAVEAMDAIEACLLSADLGTRFKAAKVLIDMFAKKIEASEREESTKALLIEALHRAHTVNTEEIGAEKMRRYRESLASGGEKGSVH